MGVVRRVAKVVDSGVVRPLRELDILSLWCPFCEYHVGDEWVFIEHLMEGHGLKKRRAQGLRTNAMNEAVQRCYELPDLC
jgi:hypothetical protein